ncbi:hypothetical protein HYC85_019989 [Camellia sinensis]|uniref:Uncharacterized protein n=1 Tax=Camellia sinensis TaxID=4442 RepID=A0A7J7GPD9_CAMSI|nr:hypothetical protein HYC85_019989 [Camellia sinensis]
MNGQDIHIKPSSGVTSHIMSAPKWAPPYHSIELSKIRACLVSGHHDGMFSI